MSIQYINTGTSANAGNGDSLRLAFTKVNNNFGYIEDIIASNTSTGGFGYTGSQGDIGYTGSQGDIGYTGSGGNGGEGNGSIVQSENPPDSPTTSTLWYNILDGRTYVYYGESWVDSSPVSQGFTGYTGSAGTGGTSGVGYDQDLYTTSSVKFNQLTLQTADGESNTIIFGDGNHEIVARDNGNNFNFWEYGGTLAEDKGFKFYTGGNKFEQDERLHIANDGIQIMKAYRLPVTDGLPGQAMTTDGDGTVSWSTATGSSGTVWTNDANGCLRVELSSTGFEAFTDASHLDLQDSGQWNVGSYQNSTVIGNDEFTNTNILSLRSGDDTYITTNLRENGNYQWKFGTDGNLTLPVGGDILDSNGTSVLGGGGSTGNIGFVTDYLYDFNGITIENADLSHGATAAVSIPANGNTSNPILLSNLYGGVRVTSGITGATQSWDFNSDGELVLPQSGAAALITTVSGGSIQIQPKPGSIETSPNGGDLLLYAGAADTEHNAAGGNVHILATDKNGGGQDIIDGIVDITTAGGTWTFGADGTTTVPGKIWAKASDNGSISFSDNGVDEHGYIKVDAGYNMTTNVDSNYYVKRASQDRLAITDTTSDFMASTDVRIKSNKSGSEYVWTFHDDGGLTFPIGNKFFGDEIITADYSGDTIIHGNQHITGNLQVDGVFTFTGTATILSVSSATFFGDTNGFGAFYAGVVGYTPLPVTVAQFTADYNDYVQLNFQNLNNGVTASTEWVATADNGNDTNNYIDMGIASSQWNGQQTNSVGTAADINDSWIYVQGDTTSSIGGNLIVGTIKNGKSVKILAGSNGADSVVAQFDAGGLVLSTGTVLTFADGSVQTTAISTTGSVVLQTLNVTNLSATNITLNGQPITGAIGYTGSAGNNGFIGSAGSVGYIGSRGYIGSAGTNGFIGSAGTNGFIGSAGTNGTNGYTGSVGVGYTGSAGMVSATNLTNLSTDISFSTVGIGAPTFITTSTGTKISYYPSETVSMVDYATGIEAGVLWNSIPSATSNFAFKWYGGTSTVATLNGLGTLTANKFVGDGSSLTNVTLAQAGNILGSGTNVTLVAGSYSYLFDNTGTLTMPANGDIVMTGTNATITAGGSITAGYNSPSGGTAFIAGNAAVNNIALGYQPTSGAANMAIRDLSTVSTYMYFDAASNTTSTNSQFVFRSSSAYTTWAKIDQYGVNQPTRPAFRVYGAGTTSNLSTTVNTNGILNGNNFAVDYNQGTALSTSTGIFTAPVAGLYSVHLVARVSNTSLAQIAVVKNYASSGPVQAMWECGANCTANHFGVSTISKLAAGDTLVIKVLMGQINFDGNDSWAVAYIG